MSNMISVASGFQYSVNIGYDLNNNDKSKNFIPTKSSLNLLEDILLSTQISSTDRARILIGPYGKGKSHIVLMMLSILMKKELNLFEKTLPKLVENVSLYKTVQNYYESKNKILPVIINGSNTSLTQAFLMALQRTLAENDLLDIMPETNYKAAVAIINRWKTEFPNTYAELQKKIGMPIINFIEDLEDYNVVAYEKFEKIYPKLTAGSVFNPFLGFDVVELYESAVKGLKPKGYSGIYVVYDEFSKFLEANISEALISDTKMLQDFAEKCNRSRENQLHLMLISHKEIANYIDTLPKQKVDGWRGVSERFLHVHLNNNFTQTYEIIASVIQKTKIQWESFCKIHKNEFSSLEHRYAEHIIFSDMGKTDVKDVIYNCYPLHPVSTFVLPRLSEQVAQNERTLFTFLSASGISTLPTFLSNYDDDKFEVITPDIIYDYFEPLFKKEVYTREFYKIYQLTTNILSKLEEGALESKIIKSLSLIYILEQFEKLKPSKDELVGIYSISYTVAEIEKAIIRLIEDEHVIYLKRSNEYLRLKQTSGVDIQQQIKDTVAGMQNKISIKDTLNASNFDSYIYPSRYNDDKEMIRYFSFEFIEEEEVSDITNWSIKSETVDADGVIYAVLPNCSTSINKLRDCIMSSSYGHKNCVFIIPKKYEDIKNIVLEYNAISLLRSKAQNDKVLLDEYEVIYDDLKEIITNFINLYTHPEEYKASYVYMGEEKNITRKAAFTGLISDICEDLYSHTPVINNESINRNEITSIANNSRNKIVAGLLRNELEKNLGLTGSGQEVSIMRSTLIRTGILVEENGMLKIELHPQDDLLANMLDVIVSFIFDVKAKGGQSFAVLYQKLTSNKNNIGLRKGLIPIYLAAVFHEFKQYLIIQDRYGQVQINVDLLMQINVNPSLFTLSYLDWNPEKEEFILHLSEIFDDYMNITEKNANSYDYIVAAMRRWYFSLPKYAKETKKDLEGKNIDKRYLAFIHLLRQNVGGHELLFEKLPAVFGYESQFNAGLWENIYAARAFYDTRLHVARLSLIDKVKTILATNKKTLKYSSLSSVIKDWCEKIDEKAFEQLFADGTEKCLGLFRTISNDEETFISKLAKTVTDLRIEDWDDNTVSDFIAKLIEHKRTAEEFHSSKALDNEALTNSYQIIFTDKNGISITKRFDQVEETKRGKLLHNAITADLDSMGHAISEQEKRQILMEILKKLC